MRTAAIVGVVALAVCGAGNGKGTALHNYEAAVYLQNNQLVDPLLLHRAKVLTAEMFGEIGVRIQWKLGDPKPPKIGQKRPDAEVVVRFATRTPPDSHPGASAYSFPYAPQSDVRVVIPCDRVVEQSAGDHGAASTLLAHVLAHEIAHVLQGITRHSEEGIMKAQWTPQDRAQMRKGPLPFTPHDAELIRAAMAKGRCIAEPAAQ